MCVILLELLVPEIDGFAFAEELRKHAVRRSIPIVVMTTKDITTEDHHRLRTGLGRPIGATKLRGILCR
jgi:CheY-like chemotaxis protein